MRVVLPHFSPLADFPLGLVHCLPFLSLAPVCHPNAIPVTRRRSPTCKEVHTRPPLDPVDRWGIGMWVGRAASDRPGEAGDRQAKKKISPLLKSRRKRIRKDKGRDDALSRLPHTAIRERHYNINIPGCRAQVHGSLLVVVRRM